MKLSEKLLCDVWICFTVLHHSFMEQFASTDFVDSQKWYLGYCWIPWWLMKYPQTKTAEKPSQKLLCVAEFSSHSLIIVFIEKVAKSVLAESAMRHTGVLWENKYPQLKQERSFLRNCFVMCEFNSLSYTCISWSRLLALFLWNLRIIFRVTLKTIQKKEISSDKNEKEAFWETAFWFVNSSHRDKPFSSWSSLLTLFLWNMQSDIWGKWRVTVEIKI